MTAQTAIVAEDTPAKPTTLPVTTHEAAVKGWQSRIASLGEELAKAQAELEEAETAAAKAVMEGHPLPDSIGPLESKVRTLHKARQMATEQLEEAEANLTAARRQEAADAAALIAPKLVEEAAALDDTLAELGHRLTTLTRLATQHARLADAAGLRRRRAADPISPTALAGAVFTAAPELFELLQTPRPPQDSRVPLAVHMGRRHGTGPQIHEVTQ